MKPEPKQRSSKLVMSEVSELFDSQIDIKESGKKKSPKKGKRWTADTKQEIADDSEEKNEEQENEVVGMWNASA